MAYEIIIKPSAQRDFDSFPTKEVVRISQRIALLANDPRPFGVQKLTSEEGYRIRSGNYRILYVVDDNKRKILVYRIKHRKEAYR
ncbi:MAG: type II toxin-antitoxin system RelE/ParE family toxin [Ignavibacteriae bacterium]|nr:type II toxin-antitoxin system RelE/ParE family toxin [Ignavibacteriota bacterium]